ncbi:MAG: AsmA family protein [Desulfobacteraceae bacterium]|nr:AsmA family protein [Desulfobacteraceae bacterium]MBC2751630.1 AsmA family protein [Desulfobacteraceae bacterium]
MRRITYALMLLTGLIVLIILVLAIAWATFDDEDYRRLAIRSVDYFTGYAMTIDGAFSLDLSTRPILSAEGIRLEARDGDPPPSLMKIGKFNVQLDLPQLISGHLVVPELQAEDVVLAIAVNDPADTEDTDEGPLLSRDIDLPVFESVRLRNIQLDVTDVADARTIPFRIQWFDMDDVRNTGPMFVSGEGTVGGEKFSIDGRMGALAEMLKEQAPYAVDYSLIVGGIRFSVAGTFDDYLDAEGADLRITGAAAETADLFGLLDIETPPLGRLQFEAAIKGDLSAPRIPFVSLSLSGDPKIQLSVEGALANALTGEGAAINFAGSCTLPEILAMIRTEGLTGLNLLRLSGRLREADGELSVEELMVGAVSEEGAAVNVAGRIALGKHFGAMALENVNLDLKALYPRSDVLRPIVLYRLPEVGPVFARARLTGALEALRLEDLAIDVGGKGPLRFMAKGLITGKIDGDQLSASDIDLTATIQSETTAILAEAYGADLPELGAISARYRLRGNFERFQVEALDLQTETAQGLKTALTGRIAFDREKSQPLRGALDLRLAVTASTLGAAMAPWDIADFTGLKDLAAKAHIAGTTDVVSLKDIDLQVGDRSQIQIRLSGDLERIDTSQDPVLAGVNLTATMAAETTAGLFSGQGTRLPELGPLQGTARIKDRQGVIDLESFKISGGTAGNPVFSAQGKVIGLSDPEAMRFTAGFETASKPWVAAYLGQEDVESTTIAGEIVARAIKNGLHVEKFIIGAADTAPLKLAVNGRIQDLAASPQIALQLEAGAADPAVIGTLTGLPVPDLAPVTVKGRIAGKMPGVAFEGEAHVGETIFTSRIRTTLSAGRPHISGEISAGTVDLAEMGLFPGVPPEEALIASKTTSPTGKKLFDKTPLLPFAALRAADLTLQLDVDKLIGRNITIEKLDVDVHLDNGRLRVQPANMAYTGGFAEMTFRVDAAKAVPTYAVKIVGEDMDVDDLLAYAHEPIILSGSLNVVTDLRSSGTSASEIASNLTGGVSFALENGQIWRMVDLLSKDVFDLLLTAADSRTYTDMHCLLGNLDFEKGVGTIDMLYMDSPKIRAKGAGTLNLSDETLDVVINPEQKGRLFKKRSAVRISGALTNPSAATVPLAEAAELYGTIVLPFVFLPLRGVEHLLALLTNDAEATPCIPAGRP